MIITHSYLGTIRGNAKYLFFLLIEDYLQDQSNFYHDLNIELERFSRNLRGFGAVVKPYAGDVDEVKANILDKNWTQDQLKKVKKTPALLMIDTDFDSFDPQENQWLILNFGSHPPHTYYVKKLLESIASAVINGEVDPFKVAHDIQYEIKAHDVVSVFEVKPSVFGVSINLLGVGGLIKKAFQKYTR